MDADADRKPVLVLEEEDVDDQNEVLEMAGTKEAEVVDSREKLVELVLNQEKKENKILEA